jgi:hypothetical protein
MSRPAAATTITLAALALLLFSAPLSAAIVRGTLSEIRKAEATIVVTSDDGKSTDVLVTRTTKIFIDGKAASAKELTTGVSVIVVTNSKGAIRITTKRVSKSKPADKPAAGGGKEISFEKHKLSFSLPAGWKVVKQEKGDHHAICILQGKSDGKMTPTIALWAGEAFIVSASGGDGLAEGTAKAATAKAGQIARNWAEGKPDRVASQRILGGVPDNPVKYGDTQFWSYEFGFKGKSYFGVSTSKREGGPLSAGCAASTASLDAVKKLMAAILAGK